MRLFEDSSGGYRGTQKWKLTGQSLRLESVHFLNPRCEKALRPTLVQALEEPCLRKEPPPQRAGFKQCETEAISLLLSEEIFGRLCAERFSIAVRGLKCSHFFGGMPGLTLEFKADEFSGVEGRGGPEGLAYSTESPLAQWLQN